MLCWLTHWGDSRIATGLIQVGAEDRAMASAVRLREDYSAAELRALARRSRDVNQSRRFLSLAGVKDGMDRGAAAKIGGMDRQTLRDWVHRFNASGPDGLIDNWTEGPKPRLSTEQLAQFAQIVEAGPDREKDGVVRWRRLDLKRVIAERFGVDFHPRYVGKLLKKLGFSHISARPRHPAQDERIVEGFKKLPARAESSSRRAVRDDADRNLVPDAMQPGPLPDWKAPHLEPERLQVVECLPSDHLSRYRTELVLLGHRVSCTPKRQG